MTAIVLVVLGAVALLASPVRRGVVAQPEFFDGTTNALLEGSDVVQTFTGSTTVSAAEVMYTTSNHDGRIRHVTGTLLELSGGRTPETWKERELARDVASFGGFPRRGPMRFSFGKVGLEAGKLYGLRLTVDSPDAKLVFMRNGLPAVSGGTLFQGGKPGGGALAFRIDAADASPGLYQAMRTAKTRPMSHPAFAVLLLLGLLAAAGLLIGEAPEPVVSAEEADGRRAA